MTDPLAEKLGINVQEGRGFFQQRLYKQNDGDNDGAIEEYSRAVQIEPDLAEAYYKRAIAKKLLAR
jgi:tetratricopeptide (TPR) repeat protein